MEEAVGWRDCKLCSLFKLRFHCACTQRNSVQWFSLYASLRCLDTYCSEILNIYYWNTCQQTGSNSLKNVQLFSLLALRAALFISSFNQILPCLSFDPPHLSISFPSSSLNHSLCLLAVTMFVLKIFLSAAQTLQIYCASAVIQPDSLQNSHKRGKDPGAGENEIKTPMPANPFPWEETNKDVFNI